jgi:hypothetical protein
LELLATVGIVLLGHGLHVRLGCGLLRLLLLLGLLLLLLRTLHLVQEVGEVGRSEKHTGQVVKTGVLLVESTVLETGLVGLVGAGSDLTLKLANVFWKRC